jgi:transposase InsO family protein
MKTLKAEEVNGKAYKPIEEARGNIGIFIDQIYNRRRLHSAIRYPKRRRLTRPPRARKGPLGKPRAVEQLTSLDWMLQASSGPE